MGGRSHLSVDRAPQFPSGALDRGGEAASAVPSGRRPDWPEGSPAPTSCSERPLSHVGTPPLAWGLLLARGSGADHSPSPLPAGVLLGTSPATWPGQALTPTPVPGV